MYEQSRHISRIVNDLRELALAESAQLPMERMPTDMQALVGDIIQALEPLAVEKDVALAHTIPALPELDVDPFRIRQVFISLLTNVLRHTPPGGSITISGGLRGGGRGVLAVADDGDGLAPAQLASVFERFYRADRSRTRATGGSGLGLAIVKAIVEAHGGQVAAHSAGSGLGSVFTVRLPC